MGKERIKLKHFKNLLVIFLIMTLLFTGCSRSSGRPNAQGNAATPAGGFGQGGPSKDNSLPVEVINIALTEAVREYQSIGNLAVSEEITVSSNTSGKVKSINYDIGDIVHKDDVLYTLDSDDLKNDISLSKSQYEKSVSDAALTLSGEQDNFDKVKELYGAGATSKTEYDDALDSLTKAKSNYEQAKRELESYHYTSTSSLNDTVIKSPIAGVVANRDIEVGEMAGSSDFIIVKIDPIIVKTNVSEEYINHISIGDKATATVQDQSYTGVISSISPIGENNSNIYPVEIELSNKNNILKPGMFAEVSFQVEKVQSQIMIPRKSILSDGDTNYVYIVENNEPKKIVIEKGFTQDGMVQILKGLNVEDQLIVKGQEYITVGTTIRIVE